MLTEEPGSNSSRSTAGRFRGFAATLWSLSLLGFVSVGLLYPWPLLGGSGYLPQAPLSLLLGLLALMLLATTPAAWRWLHLKLQQRQSGAPVRIVTRTRHVALLFPLSLGAWRACTSLAKTIDPMRVFSLLSLLFLVLALLTISTAWRWLASHWRR